MQDKTALELKVHQYHELRLKKWYRILVLVASLLIAALSLLTGITWYLAHNEHTQQFMLTTQHAELTQQWSLIKKATIEEKARREALQLLSPTQLPDILQALSEHIPAHTLLTLFDFKAPQTCIAKGYSASAEELGTFIEHLSTQGLPITLTYTARYPHALYFEIASTTCDNPKKPSHQRKKAPEKTYLIKN